MAKKAQATVTISAKNQLKAGIQDATKELGNFGKVVNNLGKLTIGAGIGAALYEIGKAASYCVGEFEKIEPVQRRLTAALGQGTKAYDSAQKTIAKYSKQTLQAGDDVTALVSKLAQLGKSAEEIDDITHAAVALSNVTGIDLNGSLSNLLNSLNGEVGELKKFIPELTSMSKEALKAGDGIQVVIDKFGKLSETVSSDSFAQTKKNIEDSWSTISQSVGEIITSELEPVFKWAEEESEKLAEKFSSWALSVREAKTGDITKNSSWWTITQLENPYNSIKALSDDDQTELLRRLYKERDEQKGFNGRWTLSSLFGLPVAIDTVENIVGKDIVDAAKNIAPIEDPDNPFIAGTNWLTEDNLPKSEAEQERIEAEEKAAKAEAEAQAASKEASEKLITSAQELTKQYGKYLAPRTDEEKIDALVDERNTIDSKLQELIKDGKGNSQEAKNLQRIIDGIDLDIDDLNQKIVDKLQEEIDEQQRIADEQAEALRLAAEEARKKAEAEAKNLQNIFFKYNPEESKKAGFQTELDAIADKLKELGEKGLQNTDEYKDLIDLQEQVFKEQQKYLDSLKKKSFTEKLGSGITDSWDSINGKEAIDDSILGSLMGSFEELFVAIQPIMQMIENPVWTMIAEIAEGFVQRIVPMINATLAPIFDFLHLIGSTIADYFLPIFNSLMESVNRVVEIVADILIPILDILAPVLDLVASILDVMHPILQATAWVFGVVMIPVKALATTLDYVINAIVFGVDWLVAWVHNIFVWWDQVEIPDWEKRMGEKTKELKEAWDFEKQYKDLEERLSGKAGPEIDGSTQTAVQNATYNGGVSVTLNIYQNAAVVGESGMDEFATMIRNKFLELDYMGR